MAAVVALAAPLFLLACSAIFQTPDSIIEKAVFDGGALGPPANYPTFPGSRDTLGSSTNSPTFPGSRDTLGSSTNSPTFPGSRDTLGSSTNSPVTTGGSPPRSSAATELLLAEVLRRCDAHSAAFLRHRHLVEKFISEATAHLSTLSPLLANVSVHHDGSAFEGTRTTDSADFDTYALLSSKAVLGHFELQRSVDGRIAELLRPGVDRSALQTDLAQMLTKDGHLDARRFKEWVFGCLETALRRAAVGHPQLRPVVYSTHGAAGTNLTAADGTLLQVDFTAQLAPPPTEGVLQPELLRPCGLTLVPPGHAAPWTVYSIVDLTLPPPSTATNAAAATSAASAAADDDAYDDADQRWFVVNTMQLELNLLSAHPPLRSIVRLLKSLSATRRWKQRFHVASFVLKHAVFWAFAEGCEQDAWRPGAGLVSPTVAALRTFEQALRSGWMGRFFVSQPTDNVLSSVSGGRPAMRRLAGEVHTIIDTLIGGNGDTIRSLFKL